MLESGILDIHLKFMNNLILEILKDNIMFEFHNHHWLI